MILKWDIEIPALTGERKRKAYVYLPVGYEDEEEARYPVIYMFDGHNLFSDEDATYGKSWGLADYLDYTETQIIVAAVECNTVGNGRLSEYSPLNFTMGGGEKIKARGKKYMDWLVGEFKPYIDCNFPTLPDREHTAIGGSSMGGLMTLYAMSRYNRYFSRGAALSPSLWVNGVSALPFIKNGKFRRDTVIYMDYGSREFSNHASQRKVFAETCSVLIEKGVHLTARIVPGGVHSEASWEKQIPYFMHVLGFYPTR